MSHMFNCIATGIGSLPITDPDKAVAMITRYIAEAPIWPQLPQKSWREHFCEQFTEGLPGLKFNPEKKSSYFDTSRDLTPELERFFERYLAKDYGYFKISEPYAAGFYAFIRAFRDGKIAGPRFVKGHVSGPLTVATTMKDETGRDIVHNEIMFDALTKGLAMKAGWQIQELKAFGVPVIIFIDDPAVTSLGSGFTAVSSDAVSDKLNEIIGTIHELGGIAGIHCCGNADWPMLFKTQADVVNFDAFGYLEKVLLYPADIAAFYKRGGTLAWGIVPTSEFMGAETVDKLIAAMENGMHRLEAAGVSRQTMLKQCLITPACGMGMLPPATSEAILNMLREVSDEMQRKI